MYPAKLSDIKDPEARHRMGVERRIVKMLVTNALSAGYELSVYDGEEYHPWTTDEAEVLDAILNTDEDWLRYRKNGAMAGTVYLVYGNSGWDVIADYSVSLEDHLAPTLRFAESLED